MKGCEPVGTGAESLDARRSKAVSLHRTGDLTAAERLYRSVLEAAAGDGEIWHRLAVLYGQQGRPAKAVDCCMAALRNGFRTSSVYVNLGVAQRDVGLLPAARAAFEQALDIEPADADLTLEHIDLLLEEGEEREALYRIGAACARFPSDERMHTEMGRLAVALNDGQLGEESFRHAVRLSPDQPESWLNLGSILFMRGDTEGSEFAYRRALDLDPECPHTYWFLAQCPGVSEDSEFAQEVLDRAAAGDTQSAAPLHFCAARIHDAAVRTEAAFQAWVTGNRLVRGSYHYAVAGDVMALQLLERSLQRWPDADANVFPADGDSIPVPIFIVGMPRSGSTLLEQLLTLHPAIDAGGEIVWLQRFVRNSAQMTGLQYPAQQLALDSTKLADIFRRYRRVLALRARQGRFITDKLPGNFTCIPTIRRLFPESLIVHVRREPLETCWSCFRHLFSGRQAFAYDLDEVGRYCVAAHEFIDHCRDRWPEYIIEVHYENLVRNPAAALEPVLQRLGLESSSGQLDTAGIPAMIQTASSLQVRAGLAAAPMVSAPRYDQHLAPLRDALLRAGRPPETQNR